MREEWREERLSGVGGKVNKVNVERTKKETNAEPRNYANQTCVESETGQDKQT
jgi:hypothetical protein